MPRMKSFLVGALVALSTLAFSANVIAAPPGGQGGQKQFKQKKPFQPQKQFKQKKPYKAYKHKKPLIQFYYYKGPGGWGPGWHCHRNFKRHHHYKHGTAWHRHVGPNCRYFRGRPFKHRPKGGSCIKIGAIWICP